MASPAAGQSSEPSPPSPPQVSLADGKALIALARAAMEDYLLHRTEADKQAIAGQLCELARFPCPAAVTLWFHGKNTGRIIQGGGNLCRNVIVAALKAMRSPDLPDRVTPEVLGSLTVELEVLGGARPVEQDSLLASIRPGLTGLRLARGGVEAYVLPGEAYLNGYDARQMRRQALVQLPLSRGSAGLPVAASIFLTRHFAGYPGGQAVWLYRGKILMPHEAIDEKIILAAAQQVGEYLITRQDREGMYHAPDVAQTPMREQLYAAYAMGMLARQTGREDLATSAFNAISRGIQAVKDMEPKAFVATDDPKGQLGASAMMVLAIDQVPREVLGKLRRQLIEAIKGAIRQDNLFWARLDGGPSDPAAPMDQYLAYLAISAAPAGAPPEGLDTGKLRAVAKALSELRGQDAVANMWRLRAGIAAGPQEAPGGRAQGCVWPTAVGETAAMDERGAFEAPAPPLPAQGPAEGPLAAAKPVKPGPSFTPPQEAPPPPSVTILTALAVVNLANDRTWPGLNPPATRPAAHEQRRELILDGQRFCYQMMYKPLEAYFADKPSDWVGAVRESPAAAPVTVQSCAAAIEAFLAGNKSVKASPE